MNFGKAIFSLINQNLGNQVDGDIYPNIAPQSASLPYIVYSLTGTSPQNTKDAPATAQLVDIQVDVVGKNFEKVVNLAKDIRTALERSSFSDTDIEVDDIAYISANSDFQEGQEIQRYILEFQMFVK
jgi:hypothetical protein